MSLFMLVVIAIETTQSDSDLPVVLYLYTHMT